MERLSTLKEKTKGKVVEIIGDTHFQSRIISIGITVGSDVEVIPVSYTHLTLPTSDLV